MSQFEFYELKTDTIEVIKDNSFMDGTKKIQTISSVNFETINKEDR